jgi:hypothetical protein
MINQDNATNLTMALATQAAVLSGLKPWASMKVLVFVLKT